MKIRMKYLTIFLAVLALEGGSCSWGQQSNPQSTRPGSAASATLTNADVIGLASAGLSDDIIIAKIRRAASNNFDTSVSGLKTLKSAGVSGRVIRVMIDPTAPDSVSAPAASVEPPAPPSENDPLSAHSPGIYVLAPGADGAVQLTKLQRVTAKQAKTSGMLASAMSYGIAKAHVRAVIDGGLADTETTDPNPFFYLYIPEDNSSFGGSSITAKDFALLKFDVKGNTREVNTATASMWGASGGTDAKARQGFTSETVKPGIYKLTLAQPLAVGQYAFQQGGALYFDFGIEPNK